MPTVLVCGFLIKEYIDSNLLNIDSRHIIEDIEKELRDGRRGIGGIGARRENEIARHIIIVSCNLVTFL